MINEQDLSQVNIDELLAVRQLLESPATVAPTSLPGSRRQHATPQPTPRSQSQVRQPQKPPQVGTQSASVKRRLIISDGREASRTAGSPSVDTAPLDTSPTPSKRACPVTPLKTTPQKPNNQESPLTRTIGTSPNLCRALQVVPDPVVDDESTRNDSSSDATEIASQGSPPSSPQQPVTYDKYGLPSDINQRFSRWLYGDMSDFSPRTKLMKDPQDEAKPDKDNPDPDVPAPETLRPPRPPPQPVKFNDELETDFGFKFITQDIEMDEPLPLEELVTPTLKSKAPSSLQAAANNNVTNGQTNPEMSSSSTTTTTTTTTTTRATNEQSVTPEGDHQGSSSRKPMLTIILEVNKTIIDRRPMLRKMKSKPPVVSQRQTEGPGDQVTSTSLIGPGEDCDDSEDDEPIVIDCDL